MKKFVLSLDLQNDKDQQRRALKTVSTLFGIDEISIDLKGKRLIVIGTVDPVSVVTKLRKKNWPVHIISVGPVKEPEMPKEEAKKEEPKKEEEAKEEAKVEEKKEEPKKEEEGKKAEPEPEMMQIISTALPYRPYRPYHTPVTTYYPGHHSMEEDPNACIIS
ncbi:heavy metal-associated isoprenylated plant protein 39-like [Salvia hispanica]|uniref:heavy metal-associated isoprenylated plant protein 39-like n=1 Tax=Salvia hispanica TaxID=49212 RepID=UPI0020097E7E|nr:heavy metal-associated isoprenylated plant protein 39-like [Salvia hispanica]